jgi:hypothetical protein
MYYTFYNDSPEKQGFKSIKEGILSLLKNENMVKEVASILLYNYNNIGFIDEKVELGYPCPLDLHCDYSRDQVMAALGYFNENKKPAFREGVKYFEDKVLNSKVALFVRESKMKDGITAPFTYLGLCEYVSHTGNKPISFVWKLEKEVPAKIINKANKTIVI